MTTLNTASGRKRHVGRACILTVLALLGAAQEALAQGPLLATRTVASWDGPESKVYCADIGWTWGFKCKGLKCHRTKWKYCTRNAVDLKRHRIIARMYGPTSIANADQQLKQIADACLVSGLVIAAIPAVVTAPLGNVSVEAIKSGVNACLKTQNALGRLVASGFEVTIEEEEFFEH
jgi:hypothetical protein